MTFMYLHLRTDKEGRVFASVKNQGAPTVSSIGGPNSRPSHGPFAVLQIDGFDSLEHVDNDEYIRELFRRFTTKEIARRMQIHMTTKELLDLLSDRLMDRR